MEEVFVREGVVWHLHVGGQVIRTTAEHPFYESRKGWMACHDMAVGDLVLYEDGQWAAVEDLLDTGVWETVYNLRIADFHTYFVGEQRLLVHDNNVPQQVKVLTPGLVQIAAKAE